MKDLFVIMGPQSDSWLLQKEPATLLECERAIRWQQIGQGQFTSMRICKRGAWAGVFIALDSGEFFEPSRAPYTQAAWDSFIESEKRFLLTLHPE
jgi:hypothetical protein